MTRGKAVKRKDKDARRRQEFNKEEDDGKKGEPFVEEGHVNIAEPALLLEENDHNLTTLLKTDDLSLLRKRLGFKELGEVPPLLAATVVDKFDLVKRLLVEGTHVDCRGPDNRTPLMWAVKNISLDMIDLLLTYNADVTLVEGSLNNAILLALQDDQWDQETFISLWNSVKDYEKLNVNHANIAGNTILHYATRRQWDVLIELLMEKKLDINCKTKRGVTPLTLAGSLNLDNIVKILLKAGANIASEDEQGCTVLCYAFSSMVLKGRKNSTVAHLIRALNTPGNTTMSAKQYIQRRLKLLMKAPGGTECYLKIITNIVTNVINYFVRYFENGLEILLDQQVFVKITHAIERHVHDQNYCHALIGVYYVLLRYCRCCFGCGHPQVSAEQLNEAFVESGATVTCLNVLKTHCASKGSYLLLAAALLPIISVFGGHYLHYGQPHKWLLNHHNDIKPYYNIFLTIGSIKLNFKANTYHLELVKNKIKAFKRVMLELDEKKHGKVKCLNQKHAKRTNVDKNSCIKAESKKSQPQIFTTNTKKDIRRAAKDMAVKLETIRTKNLVPDGQTEAKSRLSVDISENIDAYPDTVNVKETKENLSNAVPENIVVHPDPVDISAKEVPGQSENIALESEPIGGCDDTYHVVRISEDEGGFPTDSLIDIPDDKTLIGAAYMTNLFEAVITKFLDVWKWERENDFPGHRVDILATGEDSTLERLQEMLPNVEKEYIRLLRNCWQSLTEKLIQTDRNTFHKYIEYLDVLLQYYLIELSKHNGGEDKEELDASRDYKLFNLKVRKRSFKSVKRIVSFDKMDYKRVRLTKEKYFTAEKLRKTLSDDFEFSLDSGNSQASLEDSSFDGRLHKEDDGSPKAIETIGKHISTEKRNDGRRRRKTVIQRNLLTPSMSSSSSNNVLIPTTTFTYHQTHGNKYQTRRIGMLKQIITRDSPIGHRRADYTTRIRVLTRKRKVQNKRYNVKTIVTTSNVDMSKRELPSFRAMTPPPPGLSPRIEQAPPPPEELPPLLVCQPQIEPAHTTDFPPLKEESPQQDFPSQDFTPLICTQEFIPRMEPSPPPGFPPLASYYDTEPTVSLYSNNVASVEHAPSTDDPHLSGEDSRYPLSLSGSFGAISHPGSPLSVKCISLNDDPLSKIFLEGVSSWLLTLFHKNIAHYTSLNIVDDMLLVANTLYAYNLDEYLAKLRAEQTVRDHAKSLNIQIMYGLNYLHTRAFPVMHGNLKPNNVLVDISGVVKLADFGLKMCYSLFCPIPTSLMWWSTETHIQYLHHSAMYCTLESDVQIAGMLIYYIETGGVHPFGSNDSEIKVNVMRGRPIMEASIANCELIDLVEFMTQRDIANRPTFCQALGHFYFWDIMRKWKFVLTCGRVIATEKSNLMENNFHHNLDSPSMINEGLDSWILVVRDRFLIMEPIESSYPNTLTGLLRFILDCVKRDKTPSPFNFSLIDFFLTTFPTLPLTLNRILESLGFAKYLSTYHRGR